MALVHGKLSIGAALVAGLVSLSLVVPAAEAQDAAKPKVVPHDLAGRSECMMCHSGAMEAIKAVPASHAGRDNTSCAWCHAKDGEMQTKTATVVPHDLAGRGECMMCHSGAMEAIKAVPEEHKGRENKTCGWCHTAAKK
jgi:hypothetical protein